MEFSNNATLSHPASLVLETMIRDMEAIVPFLPNVESITTEEFEELPDGRLRIVRHWFGALQAAPAMVRPFLPPEWLGWIDTALWTPSEFKVDFVHEPLAKHRGSLYECRGTNYYEPDPSNPQHTVIRLNGNLVVFPKDLPGVPRFLAGRMAPQVEAFVVNLVTPNLKDLAYGLQRYLDRKSQEARVPNES